MAREQAAFGMHAHQPGRFAERQPQAAVVFGRDRDHWVGRQRVGNAGLPAQGSDRRRPRVVRGQAADPGAEPDHAVGALGQRGDAAAAQALAVARIVVEAFHHFQAGAVEDEGATARADPQAVVAVEQQALDFRAFTVFQSGERQRDPRRAVERQSPQTVAGTDPERARAVLQQHPALAGDHRPEVRIGQQFGVAGFVAPQAGLGGQPQAIRPGCPDRAHRPKRVLVEFRHAARAPGRQVQPLHFAALEQHPDALVAGAQQAADAIRNQAMGGAAPMRHQPPAAVEHADAADWMGGVNAPRGVLGEADDIAFGQ